MLNFLWEQLTAGMPDTREWAVMIVRLIAAAFAGALIGLQRQHAGKPAGLRTHILVALGTTVLMLSCEGMGPDAQSRVIQGVITGIGFIGGGSILKLAEERNIQGLTTAAGIWMTAAIGVAIGVGRIGVGLLGEVLTLLTLAAIGAIERRWRLRSGRTTAGVAPRDDI